MTTTKPLQSIEATKARQERNILKLEKAIQKRKRPRLEQSAVVVHTPYSDQRLPGLTQELLLSLLTFDNERALEIRARLEPFHFEGVYREIATPVFKYIDHYGKAPGRHLADLFANILEKEDRKAAQYKKLIKVLHALSKEGNPDFAMSELDIFVKNQHFKSALMTAMDGYQSSAGTMLDAQTLEQVQADMAKAMEASLGANRWPEPLDLETLGFYDPKPRRWVLEGLMPEGYMTLFAGHGGAGKSQIALQVAACIASGEPWLGIKVRRRRVLFVSGEDDQETLEARLYLACRHLGIPTKKVAQRLTVYSLVGHDAPLWRERPNYGTTSVYRQLKFRMRRHQTEVLILDRNGNFFAGNENDAAQVMGFVNSLLALFETERRAVLLIGHVAKLTAANPKTSQGYKGSTEWHNAARARWYLWNEDHELRLAVQKVNFGSPGQMFRFTWDSDEGLFVGAQIDGDVQEAEDEDQVEDEQDSILDAIRARLDQGEIVHAARTGAYNTFRVLSETGKLARSLADTDAGRKRFWSRLADLHTLGTVRTASIKRANRTRIEVLKLQDVEEQGRE